MTDMGRHNLLNGHRGEDGAAASPATAPKLAPFAMPHLGPVSTWTPPPPDTRADAGADIPAPSVSAREPRGDRLRRGSMWVLASGVAAIAAIVSYSHIYDLGIAHGGSGVAARLLPLSVDMLILVGELMLLHEADSKGRRFVLGWVLVWSGILATLAANVAYGAQYGVVGALIWGWPAYSFILAAGGMVAVVKRGASRNGGGHEDTTGTDTRPDTEPDTSSAFVPDIAGPPPLDITADAQPDMPPAVAADKPRSAPRASRQPAKRTPTGQERAAAVLKRSPGKSNAEVAKQVGVSEKTVQRARSELAPQQ